MRNRLLSVALAAALLAPVPALAQDCPNPMPPAQFQGAFNAIASQPTAQRKLDRALEVMNGGACLTAAQVKSVAVLFGSDDAARLEFCEAAYLRTYDRVNFYDVYDTFAAVSYAFRLHDRVAALGLAPAAPASPPGRPPQEPPPPPPSEVEVGFPDLPYPSHEGYRGRRGCEGRCPGDEQFRRIARHVFQQATDEARVVAVQDASEHVCLSMGQLMRLCTLVASEGLRLKALEAAFPRVIDLGNYGAATCLFPSPGAKSAWMAYAQGVFAPPPPPPPPPPPAPAAMTGAEFDGIMKEIRDRRFPDEKLGMLDLFMNRWFGLEQVRVVSREFPFGDKKIAVFKKLYGRCVDQGDYFKLIGELTFPSEKDELTAFIKAQGK